MIQMHNRDCMELMKEYPDGYFELAIVDPPYREENQPTQDMRKNGAMKFFSPPDVEYFREVQRVSKNQIIWGGNYFADKLEPNNNWIIWYKNNDGTGFSMCEMAWCSIRRNVKLFELRTMGFSDRIHPTQKPIKLYKWLLKNYAKPGDKILDTHGGSGSICIACHDLGFDLTWTELDADYYDAAVKRFKNHTAQLQIFQP